MQKNPTETCCFEIGVFYQIYPYQICMSYPACILHIFEQICDQNSKLVLPLPHRDLHMLETANSVEGAGKPHLAFLDNMLQKTTYQYIQNDN